MKRIISIVFVIIHLSACRNITFTTDKILVLQNKQDISLKEDSIRLYNTDGTIFMYIIFGRDSLMTSQPVKDSVLQLYENYSLISFICKSYNHKYYKIKVGQTWKYMPKNEFCTIFSYKHYFTTFFKYFQAEVGDIFYNDDFTTIKNVWSEKHQSEYDRSDTKWEDYYIIDVKGNWVNINNLGWFKWKGDNETKIYRFGIL